MRQPNRRITLRDTMTIHSTRFYSGSPIDDLKPIKPAEVIDAWNGRRPWPHGANADAHLITVRLAGNLTPIAIGLTRIRLADGWIMPAAIEEIRRAIEALPSEIPLLHGNS